MPVDQLSAESADRVARSRIGWLTVLRADGSPHTTPVWFAFDGGTLWVATGTESAKVRHLRKDRRVSLAVDGTAEAPLVAQGNAALIEHTAEPAVAAIFAGKYQWDVGDESIDGPRLLIRISVTRWLLGS